MGKPRRSAPQGMETAGRPRALMARTRRVAARRTSSSTPRRYRGFADARRGDGRGGGEQAVDSGPESGELVLHVAAEALGVDVIGGGDQAALFEERQHVGTEAVAMFEVRLSMGGSFGEQDDAGDGVDGGDIGQADGHDFRAVGGGGVEARRGRRHRLRDRADRSRNSRACRCGGREWRARFRARSFRRGGGK